MSVPKVPEPLSDESQETSAATGNGQGVPLILGTHLPPDFWEARPALRHIRQAAWSRQRSPDAVLVATFARVAAATPHSVKLPAIVGDWSTLTLLVAVIAPSGTGKSNAAGISSGLVRFGPNVVDNVPPGSGEGLIECMFGWEEDEDGQKVKRQTAYNVFVYVDEGEVLADLGRRSGSTLLPTMRSGFTGSTLGQANASQDRKRIVPAGRYVWGIVVGLQPLKAAALLDDADAGTPQRFLWAPAVDPSVPDELPDWPGPLDWEPPHSGRLRRIEDRSAGYVRHFLEVDESIAREIRAADLARVRGEVAVDPLDAHAGLLRLKVAGLLAILDERLDVNEEDWQLAATVLDASNATRSQVVGAVVAEAERAEARTSERLAKRQVRAAQRVREAHVVEVAAKVAAKVQAAPGTTVAEVRRLLSADDRGVYADALDHAKDDGSVVEVEESGQGSPRRALYPREGS